MQRTFNSLSDVRNYALDRVGAWDQAGDGRTAERAEILVDRICARITYGEPANEDALSAAWDAAEPEMSAM